MPHLGELSALVTLEFNEADLQRDLNQMEARLRGKINVPVGIDTTALEQGSKRAQTETQALSRTAVQASREQAAAARAAAAESAASAAKLREQSAQVALSARLAAQSEREGAAAGRAAMQARREEIDRVKLSMARLRAEFDDGLKDQGQYHAENQRLINTLKQMGERADFTTRELKQLADMQARLAREGNTVAGVVNPAGLSGNMATAMSSTLPGLLNGLRGVVALSPSLGAAAAQVSGVAQALQTVRVAAQGAAPTTLTVGQGMNTAAQAAGFLRVGAGGAATAVTGSATAATAAGAAFGGLALLVAGAATAANKAVDEYAKLEYSIAKVSTLTEKTPAQLGETSRELLNMSRELGMSYQDLANGLYDVLGASVEGTEEMASALDFTREAAKLAVAGATDTATATDVLTSVMNAYKISAADTKEVSDGLFRAVLDGKMSFNDLAMSLGMVTAISSQAGVSLQETLAAMATMTANGIRASSAVDYLRSLIKAIVDPSEEARGVFDDLGIAYGDNALKSKGLVGVLQEIIQKTGGSTQQMSELLGGVEAVTAATSIASGEFGRMNQNLENQANAAGSTATAYEKMAGTIQKENDRLAANWKALWAGMGEIFAPFKTMVLGGLNDLLDKANEVLQKWLEARRLRGANNNLSELENNLSLAEQSRELAIRQINAPTSSESTRRRAEINLANANEAITKLRAEIAAARADQAALEAESRVNNLTVTGTVVGEGPLLPGQERSSLLNSAIVAATGTLTGNKMADEVAGWCARWVKLTLMKAEPSAQKEIAQWFGGDATDIKNRLKNNNTLRTDLNNLQPGDVVVYDKNHVGIYIGNGMVRGNNTWGVQNGRAPVSNEGLYSLGSIAGYVRVGDLPGIKPQAARPTGGGNGGNDDDTPAPVTAADVAKAKELADALDRAEKSRDPVKIAAATRALNTWTAASKTNAEALAALRKSQEGVTRSTKDYVVTQQDLKTYGNEALRRIKDLEKAQDSGSQEQIRVAQNALNAFRDQGKAQAGVLELERAAYEARKKQRAQEERDADEAKTEAERREEARARALRTIRQGVQKDREDEYRRALETLKGAQADELAQDGLTAKQKEAIIKRTSPDILRATYALNAAIKKGKEQEAEAWRTSEEAKVLTAAEVEAEVKRRRDAARADEREANLKAQEQQRQAIQQAGRSRVEEEKKFAAEVAAGKEREARASADRLKTLEDGEIARAEGNAQRQLELTRKYSQAQFDREAAILLSKKVKDDRKDAGNQAALDANEAEYQAGLEKLRETRRAAVAAAEKAVAEEEKKGHETRLRRRQELDRRLAEGAEAARQADIKEAELTLKEGERLRQEELDEVKGNLEETLRVEREYAEKIRLLRRSVALAQYNDARRDIENRYATRPNDPNRQRELDLAVGVRDQAYAEADAEALGRVNTALETQTDKVRDLRDAYSELADGIRDKITANSVDQAALDAYLEQLGELDEAIRKAGVGQNIYLQQARANAEALYQQGIDAMVASGAYRELTDSHDRATLASQKQILSLQDLIEGMPTSAHEVKGFTQALQDLHRDGVITAQDLETILLLLPRFESELNGVGFEFAEVEQRLEAQAKLFDDVHGAYERGEIDAEEYGRRMTDLATSYTNQALAAERLGQTDVAAFFRAAATQARAMATEVGYVTDEVRELQAILQQGTDQAILAESIQKLFTLPDADVLSGAFDLFKSGGFAELDAEAQKNFMDRLKAWLPTADLKGLGREALLALLDGLSTVEGQDVQVLTDALTGALGGLDVSRLEAELGTVLTALETAKAAFTDPTDPVQVAAYRDTVQKLLADAERLAALGKDTGFADTLNGAVTGLQEEVQTAQATFEGLIDQLGTIPENALETYLGTITGEIDRATQGLANGTLGVVEYNAVISEQGAALDSLLARLEALGPEYKDSADSVRLLRDATKGLTVDAGKLADALRAADLATVRQQAGQRQTQYAAGLLSAKDLGAQTGQEVVRLGQMADNLERLGKTGAAAEVRALITTLVGGLDSLAQSEMYTGLLADSTRELEEALGVTKAPYQDQIEMLEQLKKLLPENAANIQLLIDRWKELQATTQREDGIEELLTKVQTYLGYAQEVAGSFGQLAGAFGEAEEEYDSLTGEKLQTPWKDLQANLDGAANAAGKLMALAGDVARILANPADIGAWVGAITKIVSGIAEALSGFKKAHAEAKRLQSEFQAANPLLRGEDYSKTFVRSRGFFADVFGGGPQVVQEIDKLGLPIAQTIAEGVMNGMKTGFQRYLETGNMADFAKAMETSIKGAIQQSLIDGFMNDPARQKTYAGVIKDYTDARKSGDPAQIAAATAALIAAYKADMEAATELAEDLKKLQDEAMSPEERARKEAEVARDLAGRQLSNEETALEVRYKLGLIQAEEYEKRKLELALRRIQLEMEAALAAEGLTAEQIALIREQYQLQTELAQAEYDAQVLEREKRRIQEIANLRLSNEERALAIAERAALATAEGEEKRYAVQEAFERRRLALTLRRLGQEMEAALAVEGLTQEQLALIREEYALKAQEAQQNLDLLLLDHQRQRAEAARQEAERIAEEQRRAAEQQEQTLESYRSALRGGVAALLSGENPLERLYADIRNRITQAVQDGLVAKRIAARLDPLFAELDARLTQGLDPSAVIGRIAQALPGLGLEIQTTLGPIFAALNQAIPENTRATRDNTDAVREAQFQQTTIVDFGQPLPAPGLREQFARYV